VDEILDVSQNKVTGIRLRDTYTGEKRELACQGVFIAIGHQPQTKLFEGQLDTDELGYLKVTHNVHTKVPGCFAAGDIHDHQYRQAVTAAGFGCMAAIEATRFIEEREEVIELEQSGNHEKAEELKQEVKIDEASKSLSA
jgi:thioredoxin reductase (NADPH)